MGFLKFLSKDKKKSVDELDLPPTPPPIGDDNIDMPEFSDFDEKEAPIKNDIPRISAPDNVPKMPDMDIPEFPSFPEMDDIAPPMPPEMPSMQMPKISSMNQDFMSEDMHQDGIGFDMQETVHEDAKPQEIEKPERQIPKSQSIYIRVDRFKATLGSLNSIRNDLKKSEETLIKLESVKGIKEKSFDKLKESMQDLQKKLLFIDKTLFKGD